MVASSHGRHYRLHPSSSSIQPPLSVRSCRHLVLSNTQLSVTHISYSNRLSNAPHIALQSYGTSSRLCGQSTSQTSDIRSR